MIRQILKKVILDYFYSYSFNGVPILPFSISISKLDGWAFREFLLLWVIDKVLMAYLLEPEGSNPFWCLTIRTFEPEISVSQESHYIHF